jgi:hypothetical protein
MVGANAEARTSPRSSKMERLSRTPSDFALPH